MFVSVLTIFWGLCIWMYHKVSTCIWMYLFCIFPNGVERYKKIHLDTTSLDVFFLSSPPGRKDTFRYHVSKCIFLYPCTPVWRIQKDTFRLDTLEYSLPFQRKWNRMAIWKDFSENLSCGLVIDFSASLNCFVMDTKLSAIFSRTEYVFKPKCRSITIVRKNPATYIYRFFKIPKRHKNKFIYFQLEELRWDLPLYITLHERLSPT